MGSNAVKVKTAAQKELVKRFDGLCGRHGRWEVWADWITAAACAISCAVDQAHREEREKIYRSIQEKYTESEMQAMGEMLGMLVEALEENPDQDFLGEVFMVLELSNEHNGQFFTPYDVCRAMTEITIGNAADQVNQQGWISVADPACGAGALLIAFANECRRPGRDVNYQTSVLFVAQDIDFIVGLMCYIQLSFLGCAGYVVIGDTIAHPSTALDRRGLIPRDDGNVWYTPMFCHSIWHWRRMAAVVDLMCGPQESSHKPPKGPAKRRKAEGEKTPGETLKAPETAVSFAENEHGQLTLF